MRWKWFFFFLLALGAGVLWQKPDVRKELFREIQQARVVFNELAEPYEPWQVIFVSAGLALVLSSLYSFLFREDERLWPRLKRAGFRVVRSLPLVRGKIQNEIDDYLQKLEKSSFAAKPGEKFRVVLPEKGFSHSEVLQEITTLQNVVGGVDWEKGWVSGTAYNCSPELTALTTAVYRKFAWTNPLHPDVFPYIRKMEAEVIQWCVNIFNGGKDACGSMTSGGTESILMAMRVYREIGYERGIEYPEIIVPASAHSAFKKAGDYFRMKVTRVPVDPRTRQVNLGAMAGAISKNTVALVSSAPQFPHGIVDQIQEIAQLARKNGIGMHVDCCLGGFIVPFMEKAGFEMEPFDFRVKGVTSISADTHKYGYAPKGTSVIMYANKELRQRQYFVDPMWQGGIYASPTIAGSRPGGLIAATWATMMYMGMDGYVDATRKVVSVTRRILKELRKIPGLYILGSPKGSVFAFSSKEFDIFRLSTELMEKGWNLNILQHPGSIHLAVTVVHTREGVADRFITDVRESTEEILKNPKAATTGVGAMYGSAQSIPDGSILADIAKGFIDLGYKASRPSY